MDDVIEGRAPVVILLHLLCVGIGVLVALQAAANAQLARSLAQPLWAAAIAGTVSTVAIYAMLIASRAPMPADFSAAAPWAWLGGLGGAVFVAAIALLVPRIGTAGFLVATIAGQLTAAVILDHRGWLGLSPAPVDAKRLVGLVMVLIGATLIATGKSGTRAEAPKPTPKIIAQRTDE